MQLPMQSHQQQLWCFISAHVRINKEMWEEIKELKLIVNHLCIMSAQNSEIKQVRKVLKNGTLLVHIYRAISLSLTQQAQKEAATPKQLVEMYTEKMILRHPMLFSSK